MTKEQILSLDLTKEYREAFNSWCITMERLHKSTELSDVSSKEQVEEWIGNLIQRSKIAAERKAKAKARAEEKEQQRQQILSLFEYAADAGFSQQDVCNIVIKAIKEDYNRKIQAQIDELKKKLIVDVANLEDQMM